MIDPGKTRIGQAVVKSGGGNFRVAALFIYSRPMPIFEYWQFLLLPAFFALGWMAARVDIRHVVQESRSLPRAYFQGLNFLLNEQPDKAVDAFLEAAEIDPQTIELHFALGTLFRRRGEIDRATRLHQSLATRDDLDEELRQQALLELGLDYLKVGLLDRAEEVFRKLLGTRLDVEAKRNLLGVFQQEKEWEKAIEMARQLPDLAKSNEIAEYYCELASDELMHSRPEAARAFLAAALQENRKCVRASLLEGDILMQDGQLEAAIQCWVNIEQQDPTYLALAAQRLMDAYRKLSRLKEGLALLRGYLERYPALDLLESVYQLSLECEGQEAAYRLVRDELHRNPTLLGLDKLMSARLPLVSPETQPDLELAKGIMQGYIKRLSRYRCGNCGFKARQFYWRCPACGGWDAFPPRRTEEMDSMI